MSYKTPVKPVPEFGLIDPDDRDGKKPAYVSYDRSEKWNAIVSSDNREDFSFIAVDNNIPVTDSKGSSESVCDAMLLTSATLCFVILKNQREAFLSKAISQLENTIRLFGENHDEKGFSFRKAYICNTGHPGFGVSYKNAISSFYRRNRVVLRVGTTIECR